MTNNLTQCDARPALNQLPFDVVVRIAEHLAAPGQYGNRFDLLHLALAAPNFYAPSIRTVIRAGVLFDQSLHDTSRPDTIELQVRCIGRLIGAKCLVGQAPEWSLVLPFRDFTRRILVPDATSEPLEKTFLVSRTWSTVPIELRQIQHFDLKNGRFESVPSRCRFLWISDLVAWDQVVLPASLIRLILAQPKFDHSRNMQSFMTELQASRLRQLFINFGSDEDLDVPCLLEHVPTTLTSLALDMRGSTISASLRSIMATAVIALVPHLPALHSLELIKFRMADLVMVLSALPRTKFGRLAMWVTMSVEGDAQSEDDAWIGDDKIESLARIGRLLPSSIEVLSFAMPYCWHDDDLDPDTLHLLVAQLPRVTRHLGLVLPKWDVVMAKTLSLSATLHKLALGQAICSKCTSSADIPISVLKERLPATLTSLELRGMRLGGTLGVVALMQNLPPRLVELTLAQCGLTDADVSQFSWPQSLRVLSLDRNCLTAGPVMLLKGLDVLDLQANPELGVNGSMAWVAALPMTLRELDVARTQVGDDFAAALLARAPAQHKMAVRVEGTHVSSERLVQLRSRYAVGRVWIV